MSPSSSKTVILCAPQGAGKGLRAPALMREHGCTTLIEEWWPGEPLTPGALHLTNVPPEQLPADATAIVVQFGW